ncbi:MAG TPA: GAF domain-containing protein, partial [Longimicrobiaceae bacterium]|nr:GAF domain-containing protein [Longimicrobiaceae bacterium]
MPAERSGPESSSRAEKDARRRGSVSSDPPASPVFSSDELSALLAAFGRISEALTRPAERENLLRTIADQAASLLAPASALVCTLEPEGDVLRVRLGVGALARHEGEFLPLEGSFEGRALTAGEPRRTPDLASDTHAYRPRERGIAAGPALALPLRAAGRPVGVLLVARQPGAPLFEARDEARLGMLADAAGAALENGRAFDAARGSRGELESWRRERELRAWLERYAAAARETRTAVFDWDPATDRLLWGDTLEPAVGFAPDEYAATMEELLGRVHAEDRERAAGDVEAARRGAGLRARVRLLHRNGAYRLFLLHAPPAAAGADDRATVAGAIEDLTEEGWSVTGGSAPADAVARQVIRALRHEINNPLAVILGQVQLLG